MTELSPKRVLFALAHPDDESFGSGGLIAKLVYEQQTEVNYICATKGNRGTVAPEFLEKYVSVEAVRNNELDAASAVLGFNTVFKLGYDDSGMMGSADNDNPQCLWQADETKVTRQIVEIIRQTKPQVVITFDPFGGYGHPDHILMHRATTRAFFAAGDRNQFPERGDPYTPQKLYYTVISKRFINIFIALMRLRGQNPRAVGVNKDLNMIEVRDKALDPHTVINIRRWLSYWEAAARCHASQNGFLLSIPRWVRFLLMYQQRLHRHHPPVRPYDPIETDIFEGVDEQI